MRNRSVVICAGAPDQPGNFQFRELAVTLGERGHRVVYVWHGRMIDEASFNGVRALRWPSPRPTGSRDIVFMHRLLRRSKADVILASFAGVNAAMVAACAARVPVRIPWYRTLSDQLSLDEPAFGARLRVLRKRLVYRLATNLVAVSETAREDLSTTFAVPRDKIVVIPTCRPDPQTEVAETSEPGDGPRAVCVGRLNPSKGHDVLLRALQMLDAGDPLSVECIGDGPERARLEALARDLGVSRRVRFVGNMPYLRMLGRLAQSDLAVLPYRTDAGPGTVAEALGMSLPLVASDAGGLGERLRGTGAALLVPPEDAAALAAALATLSRDANRRAQMARAARKVFVERFHMDRWLESVVAMVEQEGAA